jgi:release factor glutamine methyltransferase
VTTLAQALQAATRQLAEHGIDSAAVDARWLLAGATGLSRDRLTLHLPAALAPEAAERYAEMLAQRQQRVPVSHILGGRDFYGRWFKVTPDVLDPRPETEILVAQALQRPFTRVLDMGVGSGCILVTLLAERPQARGVGIDISPEAVLVAGDNALAHGVADRITLPQSEWWHDVGSTYDLIVSNPPYIAASEMTALAPEIGFEPRQALTDESDGLSAYRAITAGLMDHLRPGGRVLLEVGPTQAEAVVGLLRAAGLDSVTTTPDLDGRDRVLSAYRAA